MSLALSRSRVLSWGANSYGQLGSGHTTDSPIPVQFLVSDEVAHIIVSLAGGGGHSLMLTNTGELYSCGWNKNGQLGHSQESENVTLVRRVLGLPKVTKISCGWNHTLVISGTGELFGWGSNSFGQLGLPNRGASNPVPLQLSRELFGGSSVTEVAAGLRHSVALTVTGEVFTWGVGKKGQLGIGEGGIAGSSQPQKVMALNGVTCRGVAAGGYHTAAITDSGQVFCWGCNQHGQCAVTGSTAVEDDHGPAAFGGRVVSEGRDIVRVVLKPCEVGPLPAVTLVRCGWSHTLAVTTEERRLFGWGRSDYGQLGTEPVLAVKGTESSERCRTFNSVPTEIECLKGVKQVTCGSEHCIALDSQGSVVTWGWNEHGMCATGDETNVLSPHKVEVISSGNRVPHLVGAGAGHSLLLLREPNAHPDPS